MSDAASGTKTSPERESVFDPEIAAIGKINEILSPLEPQMRHRVLRWAADKFGFISSAVDKPGLSGGRKVATDPADLLDNTDSESGSFSDIASLFDSASPTTQSDKALVAGYWLQVASPDKSPDWDGFSANKELRHLGHGMDNITKALGGLINQTPRLAIQTRKAGTTRQAKKKYKLTAEGIKRVRQMLAGTGGEHTGDE
jgi:hypothetical protein